MKKRNSILTCLAIIIFCQFQVCSASQANTEKPIIGINMDVRNKNNKPRYYNIQTKYTNAIVKAGGIPVMIPPMPKQPLKEVLNTLDGVMLIGGPDYPPSLYKEKKHSSVKTMPKARSDFDIIFAKEVLTQRTFPILGICAGCQVLNIVSGGSLMQDIPSELPSSKIKHSSPNGWSKGFNTHSITLPKQSRIRKIYKKKKINVVTSHHQSVDKLGGNFIKGAMAPDGLTESIETKDKRFVIGVQWHPERDYKNNTALFKHFVKQCATFKQNQN